jgi:hypothetical protein
MADQTRAAPHRQGANADANFSMTLALLLEALGVSLQGPPPMGLQGPPPMERLGALPRSRSIAEVPSNRLPELAPR